MAQQTTTAISPMAKFKSILNAESVQAQFKNALGKHADIFSASLIDLYTGDKALQECNPSLVVAEALRAATLNLPLNKALGFAYIVSFKNKGVPTPQFLIGYKGLIQMAMRSGQYRNINADLVYEGEYKGKNKLTGEIDLSGEKQSDKVIGYFCYFELVNGFRKTYYMSTEEMAKYAKHYSPSLKFSQAATIEKLIQAGSQNEIGTQVGWLGNFNQMALKTVTRNLISKYGPLSVEMQTAIDADINADAAETRDADIQQGANTETIDAEFEEVKEDFEGKGSVAGAMPEAPAAPKMPEFPEMQ